MRAPGLGMAILAASATLLAQPTIARAGEQVARPWKPPPLVSHGSPARPLPQPVAPLALPRPLSVKIVKPPNYTKRAMALIQQNIAMQAAMRNTQSTSWAPRCKSSWSEAKLRRKGCLEPPPEEAPARQMSPALIAGARLCASAMEGDDCGAVRAARDSAAVTGPQN